MAALAGEACLALTGDAGLAFVGEAGGVFVLVVVFAGSSSMEVSSLESVSVSGSWMALNLGGDGGGSTFFGGDLAFLTGLFLVAATFLLLSSLSESDSESELSTVGFLAGEPAGFGGLLLALAPGFLKSTSSSLSLLLESLEETAAFLLKTPEETEACFFTGAGSESLSESSDDDDVEEIGFLLLLLFGLAAVLLGDVVGFALFDGDPVEVAGFGGVTSESESLLLSSSEEDILRFCAWLLDFTGLLAGLLGAA